MNQTFIEQCSQLLTPEHQNQFVTQYQKHATNQETVYLQCMFVTYWYRGQIKTILNQYPNWQGIQIPIKVQPNEIDPQITLTRYFNQALQVEADFKTILEQESQV